MRKISFLACFFLFLWISCTRDMSEVSEKDCNSVSVSYDENMKDLVVTYCAYDTKCHDGSQPGLGNYLTYEGVKVHFDGKIENRVITVGDMPPANAPGPKELTPQDFKLFSCWIEQGFDE